MNKTINIVFLLALTSVYILAGAHLTFFHARSENENVVINWQTSEESNITEFVIERKASNSVFMEIGRLEAKGDNSLYSFVDQNAYKSDDVLFIYRLKIVGSDNAYSYSNEITVSHTTSVGKRTWGSIKALFR
jgi:hypothetical protein